MSSNSRSKLSKGLALIAAVGFASAANAVSEAETDTSFFPYKKGMARVATDGRKVNVTFLKFNAPSNSQERSIWKIVPD